jgi:hypothetical protein
MSRSTRLLLAALMGLTAILPSQKAQSRLNPLRALTSGLLRSDVVIVYDTSGSMGIDRLDTDDCGWGTTDVGGDCAGSRTGSVDFCGDGLCSGMETSGGCAADCVAALGAAGGLAQCSNNGISRMEMTKMAMRAVVPKLRTTAEVGLIAFTQTGLYQYFQGMGGAKNVPVVVTEWELRKYGGWDTVNDKPAASFVWPTSSGALTGATMTLTATVVTGDGNATNSLYRRTDNGAIEKRFDWATAGGRNYNDGANTWEYVGSYYSYAQEAVNTGSSRTETVFRGPSFVDAGTTWVYRQFTASTCNWMDQGIVSANTAVLRVPMVGTGVQADYDVGLGDIIAHFNAASAGGLPSIGRTPLGEGIDLAGTHLNDRKNGTGPFGGLGADPSAACRARMVLAITDGSGFTGAVNPATAAATLLGQGIKTYVIALPGADAAFVSGIATAGGTGGSPGVLYANNVNDLQVALDDALLSSLKGEYSGNMSTSSTVSINEVQTASIIPAYEFPGWKGHLRAIDFAQPCDGANPCTAPATCYATVTDNAVCSARTPTAMAAPCGWCMLWDARTQLTGILASGTPQRRKLFTGIPHINGNPPSDPVVVAVWNGAAWVACVNGNEHVNCSGNNKGVKNVWTEASQGASSDITVPPADATIASTIQWVMNHNLGPFINSVPAVIGSPPTYNLTAAGTDHMAFAGNNANRMKMIYLASADGILHAFKASTGDEMFGYIPADAWPKLQKLAAQNGEPSDPKNFIYVLANSPRVEDDRLGNNNWRTELLMPGGPGNQHFSVIDVTAPYICDNAGNYDETMCVATNPLFKIIDHSLHIGDYKPKTPDHIFRYMGETWAVPSLFWRDNNYKSNSNFGSGYRSKTGCTYAGAQNEWFNYFENLDSWGADPNWKYQIAPDGGFLMPPSSPTCPNTLENYAVISDPATVIASDGNRQVIASYQTTLNGTLLSFKDGKTNPVVLLDAGQGAGVGHPFHYGPAVLWRTGAADKEVTIAAISGSIYEDHAYMWGGAFVSKIFMRRVLQADGAATLDPNKDNLTIPIDKICQNNFVAGYVANAANCTAGPPSVRAKPVMDPILIGDVSLTTNNSSVELLALYQDPPAGGPCATGDSFFVHLKSTGLGAGTRFQLINSLKFAGQQVTGMTIVGSGASSEVFFTANSKGNNPSGVAQRTTATFTGAGSIYGAPVIESWREVQ